MMKLIIPDDGVAVDIANLNIPIQNDGMTDWELFGAAHSGCLKIHPTAHQTLRHLAAQLEKFVEAQEQRRLKLKAKRKRQKKNRKARK